MPSDPRQDAIDFTDHETTESREPNAEAGDYIEDDPAAWEAFLEGARRYFTDNLAHLRAEFGDEGIGIAAGAMLSYLADEHGVYLGRRTTETPYTTGLRERMLNLEAEPSRSDDYRQGWSDGIDRAVDLLEAATPVSSAGQGELRHALVGTGASHYPLVQASINLGNDDTVAAKADVDRALRVLGVPDHPLDGYAYEGCDCEHCTGIRAATPPAPSEIDVERLANAWNNTPGAPLYEMGRWRRVAAEYARLAEPE